MGIPLRGFPILFPIHFYAGFMQQKKTIQQQIAELEGEPQRLDLKQCYRAFGYGTIWAAYKAIKQGKLEVEREGGRIWITPSVVEKFRAKRGFTSS